MYKAIIARIHTRELPGSDNIQLGTVAGYQVIVSKDIEDGQIGVFFKAGGQLSPALCTANDLIRRRDAEGNPAGGYFEANRRVKAIKMRGAKSEGFWAPLALLKFTGYDPSRLVEGTQFDELNGVSLCNKYFTPATMRQQGERRTNSRAETPMFPRHVETDSLLRTVQQIPKGAIIYLTAKLHGTSFRYGHVLDEVPIRSGPVSRFFARLFKRPTHRKEWQDLNGSRNVILERRGKNESGFYGKEGFRLAATSSIALHKGEVIFGELVGYIETGQPIMAPQDTTALKDKRIEKQFGPQMVYAYGCQPEQCDLYVYRIRLMNEDGHGVELSFPQMVARCRELGLKPVPLINMFVYDDGDSEGLVVEVDRLVNGESGSEAVPDSIDPSHLQEGIVVRYESEHGVGWLKHKAWVFGLLEGYLKEKDDYVDAEEVA